MQTTRSLTAAIAAAALPVLAGAASAELVYGVTQSQTLISFRSNTPNNILSGVAISGLQSNEQVMGVDFRPADNRLYAVGSFSNLYTINLASGAASLVGAGSFVPAMNGSSFGFDFNPTIDRIRLVSDANNNTVLNPNDGLATGVTNLFYAAGDVNQGADPNVTGSAYTNSFAGAVSTQLYGIDTGLDVLVTQANSAGTLMTVGSLGTDLGDSVGFDISGVTGTAYASVIDVALSRSTFWTIDLGSGAASMIGEIGGGAFVTSIAVVPTPGAASLIALGGLVGVRRRR